MTLNNDVFKYINVQGDEYILKPGASDKIKLQIRNYIENVKKLYKQNITVKGLEE